MTSTSSATPRTRTMNRETRDVSDTEVRVHEGDERLVPMRLQRFLARAGVASRRGSEDLMTAGRVTVNGVVTRELGSKVDPAVDEVAVDGRPVRLGAGAAYLMLNKPAGYLTTMRDPQGRPCVAELMPCDRYPGLFPVGRLDLDTTGLLLFTTDGDLGQLLLHPSHHVWKTYEALVDGRMRERELDPLRDGIRLDDGPCQPARCRSRGRAGHHLGGGLDPRRPEEPGEAHARSRSPPRPLPPPSKLRPPGARRPRTRFLERADRRRSLIPPESLKNQPEHPPAMRTFCRDFDWA